MLKIYLSSVVVWYCILVASATVCGKRARQNGWLSGDKSAATNGVAIVVTTACLPVLRAVIVATLFYMAVVKKEDK